VTPLLRCTTTGIAGPETFVLPFGKYHLGLPFIHFCGSRHGLDIARGLAKAGFFMQPCCA
jgi:hypothetical protein